MTIFIGHELPIPRVRAVQALLVYEDQTRTYEGTRYALTTHEITHPEGGGVEIGAGRLLGLQDQQALLDILVGSLSAESTYLPPEVVSCGGAQLAWLVPGRVRPMWFRLGKRTLRLDVPWPTLLFRVDRGSLELAALKRAIRPTADTPLYHAPLMNVYSHTALCPGNASLPQGCSLAHRAQYEAAVFDTSFTHVNHDHTLGLHGCKAVSTARHCHFWRQLHVRRSSRFPTTALVPLRRTVAQWLQQHEG
jgi:PRTRC genetic system protein B